MIEDSTTAQLGAGLKQPLTSTGCGIIIKHKRDIEGGNFIRESNLIWRNYIRNPT